MASRTPTDYVVRTTDLGAEEALHVRHPLNERSELFMTRLSDRTGLVHLGVSLARLPPGKESFAMHVHSVQEEWIYVLSGTGQVRIDDGAVAIAAGDFVGFPPGGPAHVVYNDSDADLVYLQGGDRREGDRGWFPELGIVGYKHDEGRMALVREAAIELRSMADWLVK
jgi:uncharacterized cupin superfamily protein